jgi:ribosomal protein S12 methylthiotransferase
VKAGVKELLVISQDTSAYGVDVKYRTGFVGGKPMKTRMTELCRALGELGVWVRLHYVYPYPHVDEVIPLMAEGKILPYLDVPFQHASPRILKLMKRPASAEKVLQRSQAGARSARTSPCAALHRRLSGETEAEFRDCFVSERRSSTASAASSTRRSRARRERLPERVPET